MQTAHFTLCAPCANMSVIWHPSQTRWPTWLAWKWRKKRERERKEKK